MSTSNNIVLRPRFKLELEKNKETYLDAFEHAKNTQKDFVVTRLDDHVFIKYPRYKQEFWTPQLHIEINEVSSNSCLLHGLFGPNPTVWTMFMFLHFIVAGLFIGFSIWAYTNWSLDNDYTIQLFVALLMIVAWFVLYFAGRLGKSSNRTEILELHEFMNSVIEKEEN